MSKRFRIDPVEEADFESFEVEAETYSGAKLEADRIIADKLGKGKFHWGYFVVMLK